MNPIVAYQTIYAIDILNWFEGPMTFVLLPSLHNTSFLDCLSQRPSVRLHASCCGACTIALSADNCCFPVCFFITGWPGRYWAKGKSCSLSLTEELKGCDDDVMFSRADLIEQIFWNPWNICNADLKTIYINTKAWVIIIIIQCCSFLLVVFFYW